MAEQKQGVRGVFSNLQQFLQHALDCSNPSCILPLCVNTKLKLQHSRGCKKLNCAICQEVRSLASKHSESCVDCNCRFPFCLKAKLDTHERAHLDLSKCLDAIVNDDQSAVGSAPIGRAIVTTARPQGRLESLNKSKDREPAPNLTAATPTSPSVSGLVISMDSYPPMTSNTAINHPAPFHNTSSVANSPHLRLSEKPVFQSNINAANDTANSPWYGFVEPLPTSHESTLTTTTQERTTWPSLVTARENASANTHVVTDLSSSSLPTRQQNYVSARTSQNTNKQIQQSTDQLLDTACFPTRVEAGHSSPLAMGVSPNGSAAKVNRAHNTRTLVKARLIDTLCSILQLIKQTRSTEELLICIKSLSSALGELIKKS